MDFKTRLERILDKPLADDAIRQWPQSGEQVETKARITEVESKFDSFKLGVGRRLEMGNLIVVEWTSDYGDGKLHRNVTIAELKNGQAIKVTDYWGAPFDQPEWRKALTVALQPSNIWPDAAHLEADIEEV